MSSKTDFDQKSRPSDYWIGKSHVLRWLSVCYPAPTTSKMSYKNILFWILFLMRKFATYLHYLSNMICNFLIYSDSGKYYRHLLLWIGHSPKKWLVVKLVNKVLGHSEIFLLSWKESYLFLFGNKRRRTRIQYELAAALKTDHDSFDTIFSSCIFFL